MRPTPTPGAGHWASGAPKWAAVILLCGAAVFGMAWSITMRRPLSAPAPSAPGRVPEAPAEPQPTQPGRVILREESGPESPAAGGAPAKPAPARGQPAPTARLNINTASGAELELLPGIGPALAARILEDRQANGPFKTVDDLDRVKGIGPKTLERIRDLCTAE